ncbi:MAG: glycosyltransferase family 2 protein, partial [Clostridia bacterium]|nr:glycosyltransferase family 2 protein [Clostridia bacterium]
LIVPCYNEEGNVEKFLDLVNEVFEGKVADFEFVFVNDGSRDNTRQILKNLYYNKNDKKNIQVLSFSRSFGKEAAIYAGLSHAKGDVVCLIDADLQQRPEVVLEMLEVMNSDEDIDCVTAYQEKRKEGKVISAVKSMFYEIINKISDVPFVNGASDFRLLKRNVVNALLQMTEYHRFSKGMFSYVGFNTKYIPYEVAERESGESKWSIRKLIKYALEGIFAFSTMPLKISMFIGIAFVMLSLGLFVFSFFTAIDITLVTLRLMSAIFFVGGVILAVLGIIGEYLSKMYVQGKDRPVYILKEHLDDDKNN